MRSTLHYSPFTTHQALRTTHYSRQPQLEPAPLPDLAGHDEISVHSTREIAADRETKADAVLRARQPRVDLHKGPEDRRRLGRRDAPAGVGARDLHRAAVCLAINADPTAAPGKLDRVRQQVQD